MNQPRLAIQDTTVARVVGLDDPPGLFKALLIAICPKCQGACSIFSVEGKDDASVIKCEACEHKKEVGKSPHVILNQAIEKMHNNEL